MKKYSIAVTEGDGIGPEITAEAVKVLTRVGESAGIGFEFVQAPAGGKTYKETGEPLPKDTFKKYEECDAVMKAPVGCDDNASTMIVAHKMILAVRQDFDLYVNLRPAKLFEPLRAISPLKDSAIGKGIDLMVVRENSEGLYCRKGGIDANGDGARDESVYSRRGVERIINYAFRYANENGKKKVTSVDKANLLFTSKFWRETFERIAPTHPEIKCESIYVDAMAQYLIRNPYDFDVIVTDNTFGDILSDEAAQAVGSLGLGAGANINPETRKGVFEPVHGSAPDIAGKGIANPISMILSAKMMLDFFGEMGAAAMVERAVERTLAAGVRTKDIAGGSEKFASTSQFGDEVAARVGV